MVHLAMRTSQARERLLAAAVGHALDSGIADLSLRQLAAAIGTSHRMLLYHFGSRQGLLPSRAAVSPLHGLLPLCGRALRRLGEAPPGP